MKRDLPTAEPRDAQLRLHDGRLIAYRIYGQPTGAPLYFFHGFPGSRLQAALVHDQAAHAGVALLAFDRPGFGDSQPHHGATIASIVADLADLADHLGHPRFGVIGASCGGPYALAAARLMPRRVSAVGLLGAIGPMDRPDIRRGLSPPLAALFRLARIDPALIAPRLGIDWLRWRWQPARAGRAFVKSLSAPDRALIESDATAQRAITDALADTYGQGPGASMHEARRIACFATADLAGVTAPVHLFHGGQDTLAPPAMARFMASVLPRAVLHECPRDGCLSIVVNQFSACVRAMLGG